MYIFKEKLLQLLILIGIIASSTVMACSSFVLKNGDKFVLGYNHDFAPDVDFYIMTNTRNIKKTAFVENDKPAKWTSKYGSITFNMGKEFPMAGMNEKGLVVALHSLDNGGKLPSKDERASVGNGVSWVQYQLDNSASVEDVIASDKEIRCSLGKAFPVQIHYLISDKKGNVAAIEFLRGKMVVHTGDELPVPLITNYKYDSEVKKIVDFLSFGNGDEIDLLGPEPMNRDNWKNSTDEDTLKKNSLRRCILENSFKRCILGTYKLKKYQKKLDKPFIDCAFDILESMHIYSKKDKDTWNILSTVFDPINMQIYYYTKHNKKIRKLDFKSFNLITPSSGLMYDMNKDINNAKKDFIPYSDNINTKLVQKYSKQFATTLGIAHDSPQYKEMQLEYNGIAKHPKTIQYTDTNAQK